MSMVIQVAGFPFLPCLEGGLREPLRLLVRMKEELVRAVQQVRAEGLLPVFAKVVIMVDQASLIAGLIEIEYGRPFSKSGLQKSDFDFSSRPVTVQVFGLNRYICVYHDEILVVMNNAIRQALKPFIGYEIRKADFIDVR